MDHFVSTKQSKEMLLTYPPVKINRGDLTINKVLKFVTKNIIISSSSLFLLVPLPFLFYFNVDIYIDIHPEMTSCYTRNTCHQFLEINI